MALIGVSSIVNTATMPYMIVGGLILLAITATSSVLTLLVIVNKRR